MIRFHTFYPWHDKGAYNHLTKEKDEQVTKQWVKEFNRFDLYSKGDALPDVASLKPYYKSLLQKKTRTKDSEDKQSGVKLRGSREPCSI